MLIPSFTEVYCDFLSLLPMPNITNLRDQLRRDEGDVLHAYQDEFGYWTIGVGHLIDARKGGAIPEAVSRILLEGDIVEKTKELTAALPWITTLDDARLGVLLNMAFNMGVDALLEFHNTLAAVQAGNFPVAANGMLNSKWAREVPERAARLAQQMKTGEWQ